jgi:hypothetical protein
MVSAVRGGKWGDFEIVNVNKHRFAFCAHASEAKIT